MRFSCHSLDKERQAPSFKLLARNYRGITQSLRHEMGPDHPESPARVMAIHDYLLAHGMLDFMLPCKAPAATRTQMERAHSTLYVAELVANAPTTGYRRIEPDTQMSPHTLDSAWYAAGSAVPATELIEQGKLASAFCNVRRAFGPVRFHRHTRWRHCTPLARQSDRTSTFRLPRNGRTRLPFDQSTAALAAGTTHDSEVRIDLSAPTHP